MITKNQYCVYFVQNVKLRSIHLQVDIVTRFVNTGEDLKKSIRYGWKYLEKSCFFRVYYHLR